MEQPVSIKGLPSEHVGLVKDLKNIIAAIYGSHNYPYTTERQVQSRFGVFLVHKDGTYFARAIVYIRSEPAADGTKQPQHWDVLKGGYGEHNFMGALHDLWEQLQIEISKNFTMQNDREGQSYFPSEDKVYKKK